MPTQTEKNLDDNSHTQDPTMKIKGEFATPLFRLAIVVLFGLFAFLDTLDFLYVNVDTLWPLFVIVAGGFLIQRSFLENSEGENKDE